MAENTIQEIGDVDPSKLVDEARSRLYGLPPLAAGPITGEPTVTPAPTGVNSTGGAGARPAAVCKRCGAAFELGAVNTCPACKSFVAGNAAALQHGAHARVPPAEARQSADDLLAGIIADLGGESELSTLERSVAFKLRDVEIVCRALAGDLARHGLMTPSGAKVRPSFDALMTALATFDRFSQRLGLKRRARQIGLSDYIAARKAEIGS